MLQAIRHFFEHLRGVQPGAIVMLREGYLFLVAHECSICGRLSNIRLMTAEEAIAFTRRTEQETAAS